MTDATPPEAAEPAPSSGPATDATGEGLDPESPVTALHGVGPARAAVLERLGLNTVDDLARVTPRRFEAVGPWVPLEDLGAHVGRRVLVRGQVAGVRFVRSGRGRTAVRVQLIDPDRGGEAEAVFFNQPWMREALAVGEPVAFYGGVGRPERPQLITPRRIELDGGDLKPGQLLPLYPAFEGLGPKLVRELARRAFAALDGRLDEPLDPELLDELDLPPLAEALRELHWPTGEAAFEGSRRRLALEPLLALQARLHDRRVARAAGSAVAIPIDPARSARLLERFPYRPTDGQRTILGELEHDLARSAPMRRLVQGDVGSGKTLLGVFAAATVAAEGHQVAFMAPTELLAEQHHAGQAALLERLGLRSALLSGSRPPAERRQVLSGLAAGEIDICFGTHALFSEGVEFASLGLSVIDEQHRFGVGQRQRLLAKGQDVHALLMTATPIPRTLALTLYGDVDVSTLREKPPGRAGIRTHALASKQIPRLMRFLAERLSAGQRAYWVCPRIDDSEEGRGVESAHAWLTRSKLAEHGIELVHGRLPSEERAARVERFRSGDSRVLVGTTVIEVGVDVPEATVMVIEGVERLGLAQLHQLRGRVGRGREASFCFLHGKRSAAERVALLERCDDGFELSEHDLAARGMGDLTGMRQAGANGEGLDDDAIEIGWVVRARDLIARDDGLRQRYLARAQRIQRD